MNEQETIPKMTDHLLTDDQSEELMELFKLGIGDAKGHFGVPTNSCRAANVNFTVYENDALNHINEEELCAHFQLMIEESGNEGYGETVAEGAHLSIEAGKDGYLHLVSIQLLVKGQGIGSRIVNWLEKIAKSNGFKGVLIRATQSENMNKLVINKGYIPVHTTTEERIEFGKLQGFIYNSSNDIKTDSNGNIFGYYCLTF
jgi:GNAT superfamily N-acetyltransferase